MKLEDLHKRAVEGRQNAYAPYSGHKIGASLRLNNQVIESGGNIENASYGGTVCAERVAIWNALSKNPGAKIEEIVVVSDQKEPWPPCGMCRQVIAEFGSPDTLIHVADLQRIHKTWKFGDLFPSAFTPSHLKK